MEVVAKQNTTKGGRAHEATIDALDDDAVNEYVDRITEQTGRIDIVFNATGPLAKEYGNGKNAGHLKIEKFMVPATTILRATF